MLRGSCVGEPFLCVVETARRAALTETRWNTMGRLHGRTPRRAEFRQVRSRHRSFLLLLRWIFTLTCTWMFFMALDPKRPHIWSEPNFSQTIRFEVWTVYEMGMRYEHLLHEDRTDIVPNPEYLRVVLRSMGLTSCKPAPTPSEAGSVKRKA